MEQKMKNLDGFTMIEMVISLFVLSVAVIGVYNAFSILTIATSNMSNRFTAAYLNQEGVEIIRNMRDKNWITGNADWLAGLRSCDVGCEADYRTGTTFETIPLRTYGTGSYLNIDANGFYTYSATNTNQTKFKRKITLTPVGDHILKVTVDVYWDEKSNILIPLTAPQYGTIETEDYLYNWY